MGTGFAMVTEEEGVFVTSAEVNGFTLSELRFPQSYVQAPFEPELPVSRGRARVRTLAEVGLGGGRARPRRGASGRDCGQRRLRRPEPLHARLQTARGHHA